MPLWNLHWRTAEAEGTVEGLYSSFADQELAEQDIFGRLDSHYTVSGARLLSVGIDGEPNYEFTLAYCPEHSFADSPVPQNNERQEGPFVLALSRDEDDMDEAPES